MSSVHQEIPWTGHIARVRRRPRLATSPLRMFSRRTPCIDFRPWMPASMRDQVTGAAIGKCAPARASLQAEPQLVHAGYWYWICKLQARVFADDPSAVAAAANAEELLWTSKAPFERRSCTSMPRPTPHCAPTPR